MKGKTAGIIGVLLVLSALTAWAADPAEITVGEIKIPNLNWGVRTASFSITNNTDWVKFLTVETIVEFKGHYLNPRRHSLTNYPLEPQFTNTISPTIDIPTNFGEATLRIRIYDMVDTNDALSSGAVVFEQPFTLQFHVPSGLAPYLQEKISVPPLANNSKSWDNEFSRIMCLLLQKGKTPTEIAKMAECDSSVVNQILRQWMDVGYVSKSDSGYLFNFPIISAAEAEEGKKLADDVSQKLSAQIATNLGNYRATLDSMIKAGDVTADSNDFMTGTSVVYYRYPVVGGLALWFSLGQKFITNGVPMAIYAGSDPCNAATRYYMYLTDGGDLVNGHHYYAVDPEAYKLSFFFGDTYPDFNCDKAYYDPGQPLKQGQGWSYAQGMIPEIFVMDTSKIAPAYHEILTGTDPIMTQGLEDLKTLVDKYGHTKNTLGIRYWWWNLCASRTMDRLVKDQVLTRRGNGQYKFANVK